MSQCVFAAIIVVKVTCNTATAEHVELQMVNVEQQLCGEDQQSTDLNLVALLTECKKARNDTVVV